ncbi:MAG: hypothetical protein AAGF58_09595, partial [Pseudomonadota bacterium]
MGHFIDRAFSRTCLIFIGFFILTACTDNAIIRDQVLTGDSAELMICDKENGATITGDPEILNGQVEARCAIERHTYEVTEGPIPNPKGEAYDYYMSFVEFDDQGWFWDRRQMQALMRLLDEELEKDREVLMLVFAHGWRHNSTGCNNNVLCFQRMLERIDLTERAREAGAVSGKSKARTVVGVYVGWRGLSTFVQPFELLSFWERKDTAGRVGTGGTTELLTRLDDFRALRNPNREPEGTQLLIFGHSFGAKVIHSAVSHSLIDNALDFGSCGCQVSDHGHIVPVDEDGAGSCEPVDIDRRRSCRSVEADENKGYTVARSFGDLIVLLNPAFEGSLYEPLHQAAINRCYPKHQRPVMMTITSDDDWATRYTFPVGRVAGDL